MHPPWLYPRLPYFPLGRRWKLHVYELSKSTSGLALKVEDRTAALSAPETMQFSAWQLAHAVRQAESNLMPPWPVLHFSMLGFLAEFGYLMSYKHPDFRLAPGAIGALDDFVQSSFAGRLGQGVGLLWMRQRGYKFSTRFQQLCANSSPPISLYNAKGKKIPSPDMVFSRSGAEALLETKGAFIHPSDLKPSLVQPLNKGLKQLSGWGAKFTPAIKSGFVTALRIREENDTHPEGSMLLWTDPENEPGEHSVPAGLIPTAHYAGWLNAMGATAAASRLISGGPTIEERFQLASIDGELFAVQAVCRGMRNRWVVAGIRWAILEEISILSANRRNFDEIASGHFPLPDSFAQADTDVRLEPERIVERGSHFEDGTYLGLSQLAFETAVLPF